MKAIKLLLLILVCSSTSLLAISRLQQLVELNNRWAWEASVADLDIPATHQILSERELIQYHLNEVHRVLSERTTEALSEEQRQNRSLSLEHLKTYAQRGLFPQNLHFRFRRPVFIDERGVHCAVGYLMRESGYPELSLHISYNMNYEYLLDMQDEQLNAWVEKSGFTAEELAWIQPGYFRPIDYEPMLGGVNGPVNAISGDFNLGLYAGGNFDSADGFAAAGVAYYNNGFAGPFWARVGTDGIRGEVYDILQHNGNTYMAGNFYMIDSVYTQTSVVMWDGSTWTNLGAFYVGALVNHVSDLEIYRDTLYAGGFFKADFTTPKFFSGLAKWDGQQWVHAGASVLGEVKSLHTYNGKLYVGGNFLVEDSMSVHNIFALNGNSPEYFAEDLEVIVNDIEDYMGDIYVATDFYTPNHQDSLGFGVYKNGSWQAIYGAAHFKDYTASVKCLKKYNSYLLFGGDFDIVPLIGYFGKNMAYYDNSLVHPFGMLDSTVRSMTVVGDELIIGGDFNGATTSSGGVVLNHIAKVHLPDFISIKENKFSPVALYPNPNSGVFKIKTTEALSDLEVIDVNGKIQSVRIEHSPEQIQVHADGLSSGNYFIRAKLGNGQSWTRQFVIK